MKKILILGVTASGKARLAFELARQLNGEILSVDSMKVYRRMDIGTAKASPQQRTEIRHHLIDVVEPSEYFSVGRFLELAGQAAATIESGGKRVIASGGTAMYIKAMIHGLFEGPGTDESIRNRIREQIDREGNAALYRKLAQVDPPATQRIHLNDSRRIIRALEVYELTGRGISTFQEQFGAAPNADEWIVIGVAREKTDASHRINMRVKKMIEQGLVEEVRGLLREETPLSDQARVAIGYAEIIEHLAGKLALDEAVERIKKNSRQLAKAQRTWFKTFRWVNWLDVGAEESVEDVLPRALEIIDRKSKC